MMAFTYLIMTNWGARRTAEDQTSEQLHTHKKPMMAFTYLIMTNWGARWTAEYQTREQLHTHKKLCCIIHSNYLARLRVVDYTHPLALR
jgi:hypothetical protein